MTAFVEGPEDPIERQHLTFPSAVDPSRPAVIDAAHRVFVNYEIYYVADEDLRQRFLADPPAFTGPLTDPVTLRRFQPDADSPKSEHDGRLYYFPDQASAEAFDADPNRYAVPVYKMKAM